MFVFGDLSSNVFLACLSVLLLLTEEHRWQHSLPKMTSTKNTIIEIKPLGMSFFIFLILYRDKQAESRKSNMIHITTYTRTRKEGGVYKGREEKVERKEEKKERE